MPRIFDNIESKFLSTLRETLLISHRADFCVGYFSLSGWRLIDDLVDNYGGSDNCCRLLVGMNEFPTTIVPNRKAFESGSVPIDSSTVTRLKAHVAEEFRSQLEMQIPSNSGEIGLRRLAGQLRAGKLKIRVYLRHPLHAKLYLMFRQDPVNPRVGFLGSSNLSYSGLAGQGELNVDVMDHDSTKKLAEWFDERWTDRWCIDISEELASLIDNSWAREDLISPYHIYLNIAYHLSKEARSGLAEFSVPKEFRSKLFDFQSAAVRIAAHHLNKRGGVLLGDVVGLGKTLMATAVARIFQDDFGTEAVIICPSNLVSMWQSYVHKYRLLAEIVPISLAIRKLPSLRRYRVAIIDESHNLRNREGKRYKVIRSYLQENECKCILLSATPYNKTFSDIASQLRLFLSEDEDLGIRPEKKINEVGEAAFIRANQCSPRSLAAFEASEHPDDWRDMMRLFMVRRTRTFILENYATPDKDSGRKFLVMANGEKSFFPVRIPKTVKYSTERGTSAQYAKLYSDESLSAVVGLSLPRYGLGNYVNKKSGLVPSDSESRILQGLSRAGKRLVGVCRTNLFKRLESGGPAFILSVERHILRNYIFQFAMENGLEIPIGAQAPEFLGDIADEDQEELFETENDQRTPDFSYVDFSEAESASKYAKKVYETYRSSHGTQFKWIRSEFFSPELTDDLKKDTEALAGVLKRCGKWKPETDPKIIALTDLILKKHRNEKVLVFSQFADTVKYLDSELRNRGVTELASVTGSSKDPALEAWRFSPISNEKQEVVANVGETRVLLSTDVLSEGVNLQDCAVIVNFDLPWAIIRLVQRAGRVDRIGQRADKIICYSFLPAEGIERILRLRSRVKSRLRENAEIIGTDEAFFEDEKNDQPIVDIYNEKAGVLDTEPDAEVDLASQAYQIWKNAIEKDPSLASLIPNIPPVSFSARNASHGQPSGVLLYLSLGRGSDALAWVSQDGSNVTQSQVKILEAARCSVNEPALKRSDNHHALVEKGIQLIVDSAFSVGGQLGRTSGPRYRTYERVKAFIERSHRKLDLFHTEDYWRSIDAVLEEIYRFPLKESAADSLKRQLRSGISDEDLAVLVVALSTDDMLCVRDQDQSLQEPRIVCSLGLKNQGD